MDVMPDSQEKPVRWLDARRRSALLLLAVASFMTWASLSGRVLRCVAPRYAWLTPCGAVLIAAMGLAFLLRQVECGVPAEEGTPTESWPPAPGRLLFNLAAIALPFVLALIVDPMRLSSEGMRKREIPKNVAAGPDIGDPALSGAIDWVFGFSLSGSGGAQVSSDASDAEVEQILRNATVRDVLDLVQAGRGKLLDGKFVTVIGMSEPSTSGSGSRFDLLRLVVVCCVADAITVSLDVAPLPGTTIEPGQWVRAEGVIRFDDGESYTVPVLQASTVVVIEEPSYPYL